MVGAATGAGFVGAATGVGLVGAAATAVVARSGNKRKNLSAHAGRGDGQMRRGPGGRLSARARLLAGARVLSDCPVHFIVRRSAI